jgi:apolipoprotein N-acyltransferase
MLDARYSMFDIRGWRNVFKISNVLKAGLVCGAVVGTVVYGRWRIAQSEEFVEAGPLVGSVQSNVPQSVKQTFEASDEIFEEVLGNSKASARAGAELIVWPETMVQAILNADVRPFLASPETNELYDKVIGEHARDTAFVLAGAYSAQLRREEGSSVSLARYNSAFLYRPDGEQSNKYYSKIHLVPFGEFVPFRKSFPPLYNLLMMFTPYDYDYSLEAGTEYTVFEMSGREERGAVYKFSVMICYEAAVPAIARRFARGEEGQKRLDWLVSISNDGWFVVQRKDGKIVPSSELPQHAAICAFRAVENRLAIVRSVNTGISCLIDSVGRIKDGYQAGDLPREAMKRTACAGWFNDRVPIDKRTTFFSRYGQWLDFFCALCVFLLIIVPTSARFIRNTKYAVSLRRRKKEN